ncbi:MAG: hypothetical protein ACR2LK_11370 [Solirubrobacteraceae bacterium]
MGLFRRDKPTNTHAGAGPDVSEDMEPMVGELAQIVIDSMREAPLGRETLEMLQLGLPYITQRDCSAQAVMAGQTAARLGYLSRTLEYASFEEAREPDGDLVASLGANLQTAEEQGTSDYDAMAELAAAIATSETLDPRPGEDGPTSVLPGLGAPARVMLRDELLLAMQMAPDVHIDELKRTWKYGYFLRVFDELCADEDEE